MVHRTVKIPLNSDLYSIILSQFRFHTVTFKCYEYEVAASASQYAEFIVSSKISNNVYKIDVH